MAQTRDILTSPRVAEIKRARRTLRIRAIILFSLLGISILIGLSVLSRYRKITIDTVTVAGTRIIDQDKVEALVRADIAGNYLHLFARRNAFIYPKLRISRDLLAAFPRIETLKISRDNLKTLHIAITERAGSYLWCGASVPEVKNDVGENCYFVNNDGYIFDKAPYFSGNVYFKFYIPLAQASAPLGTQMLAPEAFHALVRFTDSLHTIGLVPIYAVYGNDGVREIYLDQGNGALAPKVMFKDDNDLGKIENNLETAMQKPEFKTDILSHLHTLEYIDLRFNNKVLYKFSAQGGSALGGN